MRVTVLSYGTLGDVQPYVALGVALAARGHEVRLAAPAVHGELVRRAGLACVPLAGDPQALLRQPEARQRLVGGDVVGLLRLLRGGLSPLRASLEDEARAAVHGTDVVVGSSVTSFLADTCAEAEGARLVLCELSPLTPQSVAVTSVIDLAEVDALRARWSLPARNANPDALARARGVPVIHAFSAHLVPRHASWVPSSHHITGAFTLPESLSAAEPGAHRDTQFQAWVEADEPPIYLGFGSLPVLDPDAMDTLAREVAQQAQVRVVAGLGWTQAPEGPDPSGTVWRVRSCRHDWLFPRCRAVLHHGGAGTVHAAARAGVPQIVCSVFSDQPFWGALVAARKVGAHLPFRQLGRETLLEAVTAVTAEPCAQQAALMGERLRLERGAEQAAEVIGQL